MTIPYLGMWSLDLRPYTFADYLILTYIRLACHALWDHRKDKCFLFCNTKFMVTKLIYIGSHSVIRCSFLHLSTWACCAEIADEMQQLRVNGLFLAALVRTTEQFYHFRAVQLHIMSAYHAVILDPACTICRYIILQCACTVSRVLAPIHYFSLSFSCVFRCLAVHFHSF